MPSSGKDKAPTKKAPVGPQKPVSAGMTKGAKKMAKESPKGSRTMMGGKNRNQKKGKYNEDMEC